MNNSIQQVQQKLNTVSQMCSQIRQQEQNTVQQLFRVQQLTQDCINNLQQVGYGVQQYAQSPAWGTTGVFSTQGLFDPTTSGASTYQGLQQTFGGMQSSSGAYGGQIGTLQTQSPLADPSTMSPETYQTARYWLSGQGAVPQQGFTSGTAGFGQSSYSGVSGVTGIGANIGGVNTNLTNSEQQIATQAIKGFNQ